MALNLQRNAGMAVTAPKVIPEEAAETIEVRFLDGAGEPLDMDRVWAKFTPTQGLVMPFKAQENGTYTLTLSAADLPPLYHYGRQEYEPFGGPLRIRIAGEAGAMAASQWVDVLVGGPREPAQ